MTSPASTSFPIPTLLNGAYDEHHQGRNPHFYSNPPYGFNPSPESYAILPLSSLPLSPSELIHRGNRSLWAYQHNGDTRQEPNKKRLYPQTPPGPAPDEQQQCPRRQRTKLWQPPTHRRSNSLIKTLCADVGAICYQVEVKGVCVIRRGDNDMVNGTKLLNAVGMSRGRRDGILKNIRGRQVVKVGSMVLKGVWIAIEEARALAAKFELERDIYPLLEPRPDKHVARDPSSFSSALSASSSDTTTKSSNPCPYNHRHHHHPYHQPVSASTTPRGVPPSPDPYLVPQPRHPDGTLGGGDQAIPMGHLLSPLSSTTSLTGTEVATVTAVYHPIPTSLPPVCYFHPDMMYNSLPKYSTTTYNAEGYQQQQNQTEFDGAFFLV